MRSLDGMARMEMKMGDEVVVSNLGEKGGEVHGLCGADGLGRVEGVG